MISVRELGVTAYAEALARMREHVARRIADRDAAGDEIWLTAHPPVFTLGFASRREHLRETGDIEVVETERGGQVTYHGPGQVLAYTLLDLRRLKLGVRELVCRLEGGIIQCLAGYGLTGLRKPGAPGIYVASRFAPSPGVSATAAAPAKIASIGLKVSRGVSWHGVAVNARMDLEPFTRIDPCGYPDQAMTDVAREVGDPDGVRPDDLGRRLAAALVQSIEG